MAYRNNLPHQDAAYQAYQTYAASLGYDANIKDTATAKQFRLPLAAFPWQKSYEMRDYPDAAVLIAKTGERLELPKAIFFPVFSLREATIPRGEVSAWINVLDNL